MLLPAHIYINISIVNSTRKISDKLFKQASLSEVTVTLLQNDIKGQIDLAFIREKTTNSVNCTGIPYTTRDGGWALVTWLS